MNSQQQGKKEPENEGEGEPQERWLEELAERIGEADQPGHSSRWVPFFGREV